MTWCYHILLIVSWLVKVQILHKCFLCNSLYNRWTIRFNENLISFFISIFWVVIKTKLQYKISAKLFSKITSSIIGFCAKMNLFLHWRPTTINFILGDCIYSFFITFIVKFTLNQLSYHYIISFNYVFLGLFENIYWEKR